MIEDRNLMLQSTWSIFLFSNAVNTPKNKEIAESIPWIVRKYLPEVKDASLKGLPTSPTGGKGRAIT